MPCEIRLQWWREVLEGERTGEAAANPVAASLLKTLAHDISTHPFERVATTRRVREACQKAGARVGRATINFVISGISYSGVELTTARSAKVLAEAWADNVVGLCRGARMELSRADVAAIRAWVGGGLLTA